MLRGPCLSSIRHMYVHTCALASYLMHPHTYHPCVLLGRVYILLHPEMGRCINACLSHWNKRQKGKFDIFKFQLLIVDFHVGNCRSKLHTRGTRRGIGLLTCGGRKHMLYGSCSHCFNFQFSISNLKIEVTYTRRYTRHHKNYSCQCWVSSVSNFSIFNLLLPYMGHRTPYVRWGETHAIRQLFRLLQFSIFNLQIENWKVKIEVTYT